MAFFKSKEQKTIEKMKEKKKQIDKLKEEMDKMAKLVLKDGRLQKIEDTPKQEQPKQQEDFLPPEPPIMPPRAPPQHLRPPMPGYPSQEEVNQLRHNMMERERQMAYQQQAMYNPPMPPQVEAVTLIIEMANGAVFKYSVQTTVLKDLTVGLDEAINTQSSFPLNDRVINGRHIVSYYIE